jgi:hypothetical protein
MDTVTNVVMIADTAMVMENTDNSTYIYIRKAPQPKVEGLFVGSRASLRGKKQSPIEK